VLNAIYEADFRGFSYGLRPGRSPHDALDALTVGITRKKVNWVLDADIRDFFGQLDQAWLRKFIEHRIADRRILRLIDKWLAAGVVEDGIWPVDRAGLGAGGIGLHRCSPTSICTTSCHLWVDWWRHHEARGDVIVVRFADDFTVGFEHRDDADRFGCAIRERFARFGLELHPDKTRLIEFGRYAAERRRARGLGKPETFTFLGFTHICATGRGGRFWVRRKTDSKRMRAKLRQVHDQLKQRRYLPIPDQGRWLASVVRGHCAYYAVPGNDAAAVLSLPGDPPLVRRRCGAEASGTG
jgi:RNA-directed DNA polymerase